MPAKITDHTVLYHLTCKPGEEDMLWCVSFSRSYKTWHANNLERFSIPFFPITADQVECCATRLSLSLDQLCAAAECAGSCALDVAKALPS